MKLLKPTASELTRAQAHTADPETRFHYRYQAAFLAWDTAQWMPNNDPETAFMLYTAGNWLKARDPKTADLFYKALVRRCRSTELGDAADRQRWFPELDATGKPIVTRAPRTRATVAPPDPEPFDHADPDLNLDAPEPEEPVNDDTTLDDPALVDPSTSTDDAPVALPEP